MNTKEKAKFRKTKEWKEFREYMKAKYNSKDPITGDKLRKNWNLHHMDLNSDNYTILDENNFLPLNKGTHELLHRLYTFCTKKERVDNITSYLKKMRELNKKG
jgi:hypothetical protein